MSTPLTLKRDISPPPLRKGSTVQTTNGDKRRKSSLTDCSRRDDEQKNLSSAGPSLAAIEAGQVEIRNHLDYFTSHFKQVLRPATTARLDIDEFNQLYRRNRHVHGRHFVVHQHDHPVSGVHYDLRLQFSDSSTLSFAIPYGLPGNANSRRPTRMAIETRVHNLWNNLIESASHSTGSLLIWDTGEYEVLPWRQTDTRSTDDEHSDAAQRDGDKSSEQSHSERLAKSFQQRRIRLRLHGTRLPTNYTISMWLSSTNDRDCQPKKPKRKRRRIDPTKTANKFEIMTSSESESAEMQQVKQSLDPAVKNEQEEEQDAAAGVASDAEDEDASIRANNAYPGANNTIGSIHQRSWFLTLDKKNSGFERIRSGPDAGRRRGGWEPFFVRGRDHERSVVTGRSADEVMEDEGVDKFVGRKMWRPITG
ncbi:DNA polymerase ligase-domain-containing protein [Neohortaea acidophila]|uniref:DNA polymerase ligase-domain-containing protein n=1 Tax=Neohortaea acidophila TaxID=245834 RepID=A0A6A6PUU7_9PEZI|nr:DNA polymerase ligase-domain-containing protein [Neohortaea acidophila]KAF2483484.1 DNA polymerase ligase-domain-containing protein [Neohortaea acidophila]